MRGGLLLGLAISWHAAEARNVEAGQLQVVNLTTNGVYVAQNHTYPVGVTLIDMTDATEDISTSFGDDFDLGLVDPDKDYFVHITDSGVVINAQWDARYLYAFEAGMGSGFLWFGFGWILRLVRKVGASPRGDDF